MPADEPSFRLAEGRGLALLETEFGEEAMAMAEADEDGGLLVPPAGTAFVEFRQKDIWVWWL